MDRANLDTDKFFPTEQGLKHSEAEASADADPATEAAFSLLLRRRHKPLLLYTPLI